MKIVVCVKQVPDTEARLKVGADGKSIAENDVNWIVSPYDEFAIEEALKLKEAGGGEVVLISVGGDRVQSALRNGLAMGADSAVHLKDPLFASLDARGTAWALAAAIKPLGPDLILCGQQGVGTDDAQVPGMVAEILDLPQVTMAVKIEIDGTRAKVQREIEGATETWETTLPAVISAQKGLNEPRYASLKGIMAAKKKPITVQDASAVGLKAEDLAPKTRIVSLEMPPARQAVKMIEGDPDTQVKELLRVLHDEAKVL
jgi:electron transfer flavoprotein beta subunit